MAAFKMLSKTKAVRYSTVLKAISCYITRSNVPNLMHRNYEYNFLCHLFAVGQYPDASLKSSRMHKKLLYILPTL